MALNEIFNYHKDHNPDGYEALKVNDNVLYTAFRHNGSRRQHTYFDFLSRTVSIMVTGSNHDRTMTFDEMDAEVLALHREKLVELGGRPQPLPGKTRGIDKPAHMQRRP